MKLFFIPFAGGSAYSLAGLAAHLAPGIAYEPLELPGRGRRIREALLTTIEELADDCLATMQPHLHAPYAIMGHSMGSLLAYLVAHKIREKGLPLPQHLFLSGRGGPSSPARMNIDHTLPQEAFWVEVGRLGGVPEEVLGNEEIKEFFEPILRSDLGSVHHFKYAPVPKLPMDFTLFFGEKENINEDERRSWDAESSGKVREHIFPGGHFFLMEQLPEIGRIISDRLKP